MRMPLRSGLSWLRRRKIISQTLLLKMKKGLKKTKKKKKKGKR
jgi:hypothetical protein